ncbi:MAG: hypothetical protein JWR88_316 [Pseudonocardia sp.]|nr:hypothetical protein [Pseudonocardia sp.]
MPEFSPIWVCQVERCTSVSDIAVDARYGAARLLVTAGGIPVGLATVALTSGHATASAVRTAVDEQVGPDLAVEARPSGSAPLTVVIATRNRPESLRRCISGVLAGDHPAVTLIVVDNDPSDERSAEVVAAFNAPNVIYVREPRRGISVGRNRGLREAATPVVAFTDDDTEVDASWASRIAGAFAAEPDLVCLSGPVLAAELSTEEELAADSAFAWNKGFVRRRFSLEDPPHDSAIFPFSPGLFGIGANFAVRSGVARAVGGFDEALGTGSRSRGGEDCEFLVRLVLAGYQVGYEPSVFVWHHHRSSPQALRVQIRGYAVGLGAFLGKIALDRPARMAALRRLPAAFAQLRRIGQRESGACDHRQPHARRERALGLLSGPWIYLRTSRAVRKAGGQVPPLTVRPDQSGIALREQRADAAELR